MQKGKTVHPNNLSLRSSPEQYLPVLYDWQCRIIGGRLLVGRPTGETPSISAALKGLEAWLDREIRPIPGLPDEIRAIFQLGVWPSLGQLINMSRFAIKEYRP